MLLCDAHTTILRPLYEKLVLNLSRLPHIALARHLGNAHTLVSQLQSPALDAALGSIFATGKRGVVAATQAAATLTSASAMPTAANTSV